MSEARKWFKEKFTNDQNKVYTSKYYTPVESWPKTHLWWLQIPLYAIEIIQYDHVNLICQVAPGRNDFHYLKVPTKFINEHLENFHRIGEIISLYLSANPDTLFVEERGEGKLDFSEFVVKK